jgi:Undecaprenyl-phosphate glucose phosphotransferase
MNFAKPGSVVSDTSEPLRVMPQQRKWPISYRSISAIAVATDVVTIVACGLAAGIVYNLEQFGTTDVIPQYFGSAAVVAAFFVAVMKGYDFYDPTELLSFRTQVGSVTTTWLGVFLFLSGAVFALKIGDEFSRAAILAFFTIGLGLLITERVFYRVLLVRGLNKQKFSARPAILITDNSSAANADLLPSLLRHGFQLSRQFALADDRWDSEQQEKIVSEVISYLRGSPIDEIIVSLDVKRWEDFTKLFSGLRMLPLPVYLVPTGTAADILRRPSHAMGDSICIELQREPLGTFERCLKRSFDLFAATVGIVLLLPLLVITAVLIKLDSPGPVLFRQRRNGFNGRQFDIFKFRTMTVLEDGPMVCQAAPSDCRVTRLGKWLRRTSIDELPQLLNVLQGHMSLIGPRPHAVAHDSQFDKIVSNYAFRHHVKPGLTGWAQVNGHRGPTPTVADIRKRVECDLWYIDNWSMRLDFIIIIRTFIEIMRARNAW